MPSSSRKCLAAAVFVSAALLSVSVATPQTVTAIQVTPAQLAFNDTNVSFSQTLLVAFDGDPITLDVSIDGGSASAPAPSWLDVGARAVSAPGRLKVFVSRLPAPGKYSARILLRGRVAGATSTPAVVGVTLDLTGNGSAFGINPDSAQFIGQAGGFIPGQFVFLKNATCAEVTVRNPEAWLNIVPEPIPNCNRFLVSLRGSLIRGRLYRGVVSFTKGTARADLAVSAFLIPPGPALNTSPSGLQFESREGNGNGVTRNITVSNTGPGAFEWTARVVDVGLPTSWISLGAINGKADQETDGRIPVRVEPGRLTAGTYYGLVEVSAAGARSSPDLIPLILRVESASAPPSAAPSPSGLLFNVLESSGASEPQQVTIFTSSTAAASFRAGVSEDDGFVDWLGVGPASGVTSTAVPGRLLVTVRPGVLKPGAYRGTVNTIVGTRTAEVRAVNVTMVIRPKPPVAPPPPTLPPRGTVSDASSGQPQADNCIPTKLAPTHTGLVSGFATRVGWPTPLNIRVVDDCGDVSQGAQAVLSFSNGDPPLVLTSLLDGNYAGTWVPRNAAPDAMTIRADVAQATLSASLELPGRVTTTTTPIVAPNGVVNNFDRVSYGPLAPGTLVEIYGTNLAGGAVVSKLENGKLPDTVNDVSVILGSSRLPLYAVSPGLINAQIATEAAVDQFLPLVVRAGTNLSVPVRIPIVGQQPGVLQFADTKVIAHDENFALTGSTTNPARRGRYIILYVVGMGNTSPQLASGLIAPGAPPATVQAPPRVTFGGRAGQILFSGLTPGLVGLYQINVVVPPEITAGEVTVVVAQGEDNTSSVKMQIQ